MNAATRCMQQQHVAASSWIGQQRQPRGASVVPARFPQQQQQRMLVIQQALSRQAKESTVDKLVPLLEDSTVVVGLRYQGMTVKQMQEFRRSLPKEGATLLVCKNTLLRLAADKVDGWEELKPSAKGDNAWLFVQEETISESIKAYLKYQKGLVDAAPPDERDNVTALKLSGGVMSGKSLTEADIKRLEKLPTKTELMATIARLLNQLPTKIAVSVKQVPTKVALGVKALADTEHENRESLVGDVCKPSE